MASHHTRSVTLPATSAILAGRSTARLRLLTYRMALAQPGASIPLLHSKTTATGAERFSSLRQASSGDATRDGSALVTRRWVREADELCVASIRRSNNVNRINSYVATYKLDDPHWRPFLLPEVHVVPRSQTPVITTDPSPPASTTVPETACGGGDQDTSTGSKAPVFDVFIDYNKLVNVELVARHANYALRHLVQKGHAMYFVNFAQHSILQMRGLIESSFVTCAYGIRGERLRTYLTHIGPLDVRDVIDIDPVTRRVSFDLTRPGVRRGVVALSQVEGYGTWFQRKPMLWQRTRRIGALQSQMGAYEYQLAAPATVGRVRDYEVSLLEPHIKLFDPVAGGGAEALGLIAASQVAQNERLYVGQFEAPVITAVDAVQQLAHRAALRHRLLHPPPPLALQDGRCGAGGELARLLGMERLLPVSWVTRTPPPYVPLEADLPFKIQLSKATVFPCAGQQQQQQRSLCTTNTAAMAVTPALATSGTVGTPLVENVPLTFFEYNIHQGVDHYVFDDAPSARPMKWWNQKSNMPYNGYMYFMRSGLLDRVRCAEQVVNPLAPARPAPRGGGKLRTVTEEARHGYTASMPMTTKTLSSLPEATTTREGLTARTANTEPSYVAAEIWTGQQHELHGYGVDERQARNTVAADTSSVRRAVGALVPPGDAARRRSAAYHRAARTRRDEDDSGLVSVTCASTRVLRNAIALHHHRKHSSRSQSRRPPAAPVTRNKIADKADTIRSCKTTNTVK